ncbi:unnamed protein product [Victoria cruziana]
MHREHAKESAAQNYDSHGRIITEDRPVAAIGYRRESGCRSFDLRRPNGEVAERCNDFDGMAKELASTINCPAFTSRRSRPRVSNYRRLFYMPDGDRNELIRKKG